MTKLEQLYAAERDLEQRLAVLREQIREEVNYLGLNKKLQPYRPICRDCGGNIVGDGYTSVMRCENYDGDTDVAPDSGPLHCGCVA